ncbi:hypothetical protein FHS85_002922 [Rhodoligotrophos appendicifer]|uniref:GTA-gp10 family protein n=1 Tax=Rhodoligotrophos appendicifer TaxID=987056 RepID=UPI001185CE4B|nr:GTA-gp10 family protein [Rhodoligotrophos appendicifer]
MANPVRGEVGFDVEGREYTLRFSTNALCELEAETGLNANKIVGQMQDPDGVSLRLLRAIIWAGLIDHHQGIKVADAGVIVDRIGIAKAGELIGKAFTAAFPAAAEEAASSRPPKGARAGTGKAS